MRRLLGPRLVLTTAALAIVVTTIAVSLSGSLIRSHAVAASGLVTPTDTTGSSILVYNGAGVSGDYKAVVNIITTYSHYTYDLVGTAQLESMSLAQLSRYRLIVWPGGNSGIQSSNLTPATRQKVHDAVVKNGVSYFGICAGTFIAVAPKPPSQGGWGLGIVPAPHLTVYPAVPNPTLSTYKYVWTTFADGTQRNVLWWDGPIAPTLPHGIISKYPKGYPEMVESMEGNGFVVLTGTHPELNPPATSGITPVNDHDISWKLLNAAYTRTPLPHF